jgi:hypothetical protein
VDSRNLGGVRLHQRSRVRRDREDRDRAGLGAVAPEDVVGTGRVVLGVGLEYLRRRIEGMHERMVFVGVQVSAVASSDYRRVNTRASPATGQPRRRRRRGRARE